MANSYFQFKQFTVHQDMCAMKVCTDACLFGAVTARFFQQKFNTKTSTGNNIESSGRMLDVGSGTGLLTLMMAQKLIGEIDAIEINADAYTQSQQNILSSPWKDRIHPVHADFTTHAFTKKYDLIFSNPPFFKNHLRSPEAAINLARHTDGFDAKQFTKAVTNLLNPEGSFALLIPYHQSAEFLIAATEAGLYLSYHLGVKQTEKHELFRSILIFNLEMPISIIREELIIKEGNSYSENFIALMKDYYLYL